MTFTLITPQSGCWAEVAELYESAFPQEERRDTEEWQTMAQTVPNFHIMALTEADELCGFISYWNLDGFIYVEHFAVSPTRRNKGIGSYIFRQLQEQIGSHPVVLEVEPPENEMASRRIIFYNRLGFSISERTYLQPPYRKNDSWFPLYLMCTDEQYLNTQFDTIKQTIHQKVYGVV